MNALRAVAAVARADVLERVRRTSFLVTLAATIVAAKMFVPPNDAHYVTLQFDGYRGIYNSAWVGALVAMMTTTFLSFAGFYLVKNAVERDRMTGVGQVLATTPLRGALYLAAKALSNFVVLVAMVAVVVVAAGVLQVVLGEDRAVHAPALVAPFVAFTLPVMALVAACAVFFECVPGLRGGLGNVVWFFLWITFMSLASVRIHPGGLFSDVLGSQTILPSMVRGCLDAFPHSGASTDRFSMGFNIKSHGVWHLRTFAWHGVALSGITLARGATWLAVAVAIVPLAANPFDRFDAAPRVRRSRRVVRGAERPEIVSASSKAVALPALPPVRRAFRLDALVGAELRLLLQGRAWAWFGVAIGLAVACAFAPIAAARQILAPLAWGWPVLVWSALGTRESRHGTGALLFSSAHPIARQLPAAWLAGALLAAATGAGFGARLALAGDGPGLATWAAGVAFIPALALAFGAWSGSAKLFEVIYLLVWYAGPMSKAPGLDFTGGTAPSFATATGFLVAAVVLGALAVVGRQRRLRN